MKSANILFSVGLDARWAAQGVRSLAVHPGGPSSDTFRPKSTRPDLPLEARPCATDVVQKVKVRPAFR